MRRGAVVEALCVVAGYLAVAVYATWPLAKNPLGGFYGFGNDNLGGIWVYGAIHDAYLGGGSATRSAELQAPFGYQIPDQALQPMDRLYSLVFGGLDHGLGAYNAQIFLSFIFAGCTMYVLARYLTGNRAAAAVAGFIYTYSPFHLALAMQYNSLAAIEWVPLYLLALIVFLRRGRLRDAVWAGAAYALVAITSYYYAWFLLWGTAMIATAFVARLAWRHRRSGTLSASAAVRFAKAGAVRVGAAAGTALLIVIPLVIPSIRVANDPDVVAQTVHPISEAVRYSVRPWMFVLPPHDGPVSGGRVDNLIFSNLFESPVYEQSVYLGFAVLLLAAIGLWRRGSRRLGPLTDAGSFARPLLVTGVLGGMLIMLGPYIPLETGYWRSWADVSGIARIPSLGALMFELVPNFRFFVRAFILVSPCLAALAALGFARLARPVGAPRRTPQVVLAALTIAIIGIEFTNAPPHVFASDSTPAWVRAVKALPGDLPLADYPLAPLSSPRSLYYIFWQREHGKPTVNPAESEKAKAFAARIVNPDDPASGRNLSAAGIRYVVIHTHLPPQSSPPYMPVLPDDSLPTDVGAHNPWFERVAETDDAVIYRVLRSPRAGGGVVARTGAGFGAREPEAGTTAQWLEADEGQVLVFGADGRRVRLSLVAGSFAQPRVVTFRTEGRVIGKVTVPSSRVAISVDLGVLPRGTHVVTLTALPGPQVIGDGDPRSVSIRVRDVRAKEAR